MSDKERMIYELLVEATECEDICNALEGKCSPKLVIGDEEYFLDGEEITMLVSFYTTKRNNATKKLKMLGVEGV